MFGVGAAVGGANRVCAGCSLCEALETKLRGVLDAASFQPGGELSRAVLVTREAGGEGGVSPEEVPRLGVEREGGAVSLLPPFSPRTTASKLARELEKILSDGG